MSDTICSSSNLSHENVTDALWLLEGELKTNGQVIAVFLLIFLLVGVPANVYVIGSILKLKLYQQPAFIPLLNLAVSDLLICVLVMPINVVSGMAGTFPFGGSDYIRCQVCKMACILTVLSFVSVFSLMLVSVDRFLYIKIPLRYGRTITSNRMIVAVIVTWFFSVVISILPVVGFGIIDFSFFAAACVLDFPRSGNYLLLLMMVVIVVIVILLVTNTWTLCIVHRNLKQIYVQYRSCDCDAQRRELASELNNRIRTQKNKKQRNIIRIFAAIFLTDIFTWLPWIILVIGTVAVGLENFHFAYITFSYLVYLSQSFLHPLLQVSIISEIKQPILKFYSKCRGTHLGSPATTSDSSPNTKCTCFKSHDRNSCCCVLNAFCLAILPDSIGVPSS